MVTASTIPGLYIVYYWQAGVLKHKYITMQEYLLMEVKLEACI